MKKSHKTLVLAMGTSLMSGLASVATAESLETQTAVFQISELSSGYMQLAADSGSTAKAPEAKCAGAKPITAPKHEEGKCGEGKCGGTMKPATASGATKPADSAAAKPAADAAAKPATDTAKAGEGKCGEGKCGGSMKKATDANAQPATSTAPVPK